MQQSSSYLVITDKSSKPSTIVTVFYPILAIFSPVHWEEWVPGGDTQQKDIATNILNGPEGRFKEVLRNLRITEEIHYVSNIHV